MKKKCLWCSQDKSLEAFGFDRRSTDGRQAVDHDHKTDRVRAILCDRCNAALGMLKESPTRVRALLRYIEKYCRTPKPAQLPLLAER